ASSSCCRPTKRVRLRAAAACKRRRSALAPTSSKTSTGSTVFVGNGSAKQRHDAIAKHLVHCAFEAVHGVHHEMDGGIEELLGGFGIEPSDEFGRVLEVGKEHGHLLALTLQSGAGCEDLVAEMGRRVGERCPVLGWCGG